MVCVNVCFDLVKSEAHSFMGTGNVYQIIGLLVCFAFVPPFLCLSILPYCLYIFPCYCIVCLLVFSPVVHDLSILLYCLSCLFFPICTSFYITVLSCFSFCMSFHITV